MPRGRAVSGSRARSPAAASAGLDLEVFRALFASIAEEMGVVVQRSAVSPNIKERRDYSCALFSAKGELIAQAAHIPVHLGSAPLSVRAAMAEHTFRPGDSVVLNDPYRGGTHLPDLTVVTGLFLRGGRRPDLFVANRAHETVLLFGQHVREVADHLRRGANTAQRPAASFD